MNFINSLYAFKYLGFLIYFLTVIGLCALILLLSSILGGKSQSRHKHKPFESGIDPVDELPLNVSIKFYLVAIYFVLFDVEAMYLYLWAINIYKVGWLGFVEVLFFILFLLCGLIYLIRLNALNWDQNRL
ncbi:MAG: NADH-quinone oxidoreductase subunit A [Buchnera aphidicola (Nurudea yanoniella)]